ncbi:MAG: hypothetical protein ISN29_04950 [Gammaproteobacteria bacterium AqS3]|nr:hypothetical protein [Gammaproteobacteria bacterium AqS3]
MSPSFLVSAAFFAGAYPWPAAEKEGCGDSKGVDVVLVYFWLLTLGFGFIVGRAVALIIF